jgi:hypothetical protein
MLRKLLIVGVVSLLPSLAMAVPQAGDWELTLNGTGASDNDFDNHSLGASGQLGYYFTDPAQIYIRQSASYSDGDDTDSVWAGSTRVGLDYHFQIGDQWRPFVGANIGYAYGDLVDDSWIASLEGGVKYYVNASTFVFGIVEYQFLVEESFGDGSFVYGLGIGFNF